MKNKLLSLVNRFDSRSAFRNFTLLTAGGLIMALAMNLFLIPAQIAPGGVSGIAIIIHNFIDWPIGLMSFVLNVPLLFLGLKYLGRFNFLIRTLYTAVVFSLGVDLLAPLLPAGGLTEDLMLDALFGGIVGGIGSGLVYRGRGTSGGTGILSRVLQFKTGFPISQVYLITDGFIVLIAGFVFGWEKALYALITLFIWGIATDQVLEGPSVVRTALIVTDRPKQVAGAVFDRLRLGITSWSAQGMYSERKHTVLFFVVSRPAVDALKSVVLEADSRAFIVISHGHNVVGGVKRQALQALRTK